MTAVRVIAAFRDAETGEVHEPGERMTIPDERAQRLMDALCVVADVDDEAAAPAPAKPVRKAR